MSTETHMSPRHDGPAWWATPGEVDVFAIAALVFLFLIIFLVVHVYARFDRHAEAKAESTPLRTTVPTLLTVALAYEIFPPLSHFSVLLPTSLILAALARDFMLWWPTSREGRRQ